MLGVVMGVLLLAAQDEKPLAGSLPPLPPPPERGMHGPDDRPRGKLFISPMGEPFRGPDPIGQWFDGADANHDGALTRAEFEADAARFFAVLDRGRDGEIDPDDIDYYETRLVPEIRVGGEGGGMPGGRTGGGRRGGGGGRRGGGPPGGGGMGGGGMGGGGMGGDGAGSRPAQHYADTRRGAALYGFFDFPEPITVADANFNRGVDPGEFRAADARFALLDRNHDGRITRGDLPHIVLNDGGGGRPPSGGHRRGDGPGVPLGGDGGRPGDRDGN